MTRGQLIAVWMCNGALALGFAAGFRLAEAMYR